MVSNMQLERCMGRGDDQMKNRAIKISVSLPLKLVEKLDQITTYRGKSRSRYISGAVSQRLEGRKTDAMDEDDTIYLGMLLMRREDCPDYVKAMLEHWMVKLNDS